MVSLSTRPRAFLSGYGLGLSGAVAALVLSLLGVLVLQVLGLAGLEVPAAGRLVALLVLGQYVPFMGLPLLYLRVGREFSWPEVRSYFGVRLPSLMEVGVYVGGLIALFALVSGTAFLVTEVLNLTPASNNAGELAQQSPGLAPLLIVASILVIGPCEETLFRGVVQNRIREAFSAPVAITLAAALFAAIHVTALTGGLGARAVTIVILLVPSFVFGAAYEVTDNLVVPAAIHGTWNALIFTSIYLAARGAIPAGETVLLPFV
ncbi:type II CAAX prenyl endopeptidase Rce1 family protein [Halobaculum sp. MBLA0147]|uniref:CPBP family glutamic-type intramembrane protease n=1 Tax=Halobaculum sp. MBLA0147 TaxID=3079934 RepID=UPI0035251C8F